MSRAQLLVCPLLSGGPHETLTQEDENRIAPAVLKLLSGILEMLPVAYMVRIETADQQVLEQVNPQLSSWDAAQTPAGPADDVTRPFIES